MPARSPAASTRPFSFHRRKQTAAALFDNPVYLQNPANVKASGSSRNLDSADIMMACVLAKSPSRYFRWRRPRSSARNERSSPFPSSREDEALSKAHPGAIASSLDPPWLRELPDHGLET